MRGNKVGLCIWDADIIFLKRGFDYILQDADHRVEIESRARLWGRRTCPVDHVSGDYDDDHDYDYDDDFDRDHVPGDHDYDDLDDYDDDCEGGPVDEDHFPGDYDDEYQYELDQMKLVKWYQSHPKILQNSCPDCDPASSFYGGDHCCKDVPQVLMMMIAILVHWAGLWSWKFYILIIFLNYGKINLMFFSQKDMECHEQCAKPRFVPGKCIIWMKSLDAFILL